MGRIAQQETAGLDRPEVVVTAVASGGNRFTVIRLVGEIDLHVAPELMERVRGAIERGDVTLLFDLTDASFIDSTTLGSMVSAQKRLRARGGRLGVVCPDPMMAKIFSITGLDRMFPVHESLASLLGALRSAEAAVQAPAAS
jgi:anti-sigma B factor antagonist